MEKRKISHASPEPGPQPGWLPVENLATVEFTSESASQPIEAVFRLSSETGSGWQADEPGAQTIRLRFEEPIDLQRIRIVVEERERVRTQQTVIRALSEPGGEWREVVRQQFNFSPSGATREQEDYVVTLPAVTALELEIIPDLSGGDARATLQQFRLA
jgi:hypothetical protein